MFRLACVYVFPFQLELFAAQLGNLGLTADVLIMFYVGSGLELKHMEKGEIELPWDDCFHLRNGLAAGAFTGAAGVGGPCLRPFSTCAAGLWPALLLGQPGFEGSPA